MEAFDLLDLGGTELDIFERHLAVFKRDAAAESIRQGARLIVNFLEHEMGVAVLARRHRVPSDLFDRSVNRFAFAVQQAIGAQHHLADLAVFQKRHFTRVIQQRGNIRSDKRFAFAPADHDRRRIFRHDQSRGVAPVEKKQGVRTVDFAQRAAHGVEKIHAALDFFGDQMGDDLAIRLRAEVGAALGQLLFQFEIIFNDAIMNHDDVAGAVRMGIGFRRPAMSRPARVADADGAGHGLAVKQGSPGYRACLRSAESPLGHR